MSEKPGFDDLEAASRPGRALSTGTKPLLVLAKIRGILDSFTLAEPSLTLGEIHSRTGYPTSTVQRLVANLVAEGFLDRVGDRVRIGVRLAYWAAPAGDTMSTIDAVKPSLVWLRDRTGESACLFRREGLFRVCIALEETRHAIRRAMHVGMILPLHAGSAGRVLLAWDDATLEKLLQGDLSRYTPATITDKDVVRARVHEARLAGYAITADERDEGAIGLSAPIFDSMSHVVGAMTVSGPSYRIPREQVQAWVEDVVVAAEHATRMLGGRLPY